MNKDEMIKEMAEILNKNCGNCSICEFAGKSTATLDCTELCYATALYNANCRIIAEDEIVIKKQAYEKFVEEFAKQEEIAHSYEQGYAELLETNHQLQDELEKTKQEKRDILQELKEMFGTSREFNWIGAGMGGIGDHISDRIEQFAKEKGIELED